MIYLLHQGLLYKRKWPPLSLHLSAAFHHITSHKRRTTWTRRRSQSGNIDGERLMLAGQRNCCGLFHFTGTLALLPEAIWLVTLKWKQTFVTDPKTHSGSKIPGEQHDRANEVGPSSSWICALAFVLCMWFCSKWNQRFHYRGKRWKNCLSLHRNVHFTQTRLQLWCQRIDKRCSVNELILDSHDIEDNDGLIVFQETLKKNCYKNTQRRGKCCGLERESCVEWQHARKKRRGAPDSSTQLSWRPQSREARHHGQRPEHLRVLL